MLKLQGENIFLRALEPEDLDFLYELENNGDVWEISGTTAPYSKFILRQYLENAHKDIFEAKQLRLCICKHDHNVAHKYAVQHKKGHNKENELQSTSTCYF